MEPRDIVRATFRAWVVSPRAYTTGILASCYGLPFCTHGRSLVNLNILRALRDAMYIERGILSDEWLEHFEDGCILAPEGPRFSR